MAPGPGSRLHRRAASANSTWRPKAPAAYSYLLGAYLGDGCLSVMSGRSACLVIVLDSAYPGIVAEVESAAKAVLPETPVRRHLRLDGATAVKVHHPALPFAFPQHGPGRKHLRPIALTDWQAELTAEFRASCSGA